MRTILVLEDNAERIAAFRRAVDGFGGAFELRIWRDAPSMCRECEALFSTAALISLDHDLSPLPGTALDTAAKAFGGQGSLGNGSAMRVAPLGAYFADDLKRCAAEARASSVVTHTHPEGVAGAIAVALAAAAAWQLKDRSAGDRSRAFFDSVLRHTPDGRVQRGILLASTIPGDIPAGDVARALGNGSLVTAPDTVPFCLWMAAQHASRFVDALGETLRVGGDCDTNAAIVGGIVALSAGRESLPAGWLKAREPVQIG